MGQGIYLSPVNYKNGEEVSSEMGKYFPLLSIKEVERKSGLLLGKHFLLLSVEESERKSGMEGKIYPSPVSLSSREEVMNGKGRYILLMSVNEAERKSGIIKEIQYIPLLSVKETER